VFWACLCLALLAALPARKWHAPTAVPRPPALTDPHDDDLERPQHGCDSLCGLPQACASGQGPQSALHHHKGSTEFGVKGTGDFYASCRNKYILYYTMYWWIETRDTSHHLGVMLLRQFHTSPQCNMSTLCKKLKLKIFSSVLQITFKNESKSL
jgi:hypothetical protein